MKSNSFQRVVFIVCVIVIILGGIMSVSHIKAGTEVLISGVAVLLIATLLSLFTFKNESEQSLGTYPNVAQSFGITGIVILGMIFLTPIMMIGEKLFNKESAILLYYIAAVGVPLIIVYAIRTSKTGSKNIDFKRMNIAIIPMIMIGTLALVYGVISPVGNLIPMSDTIKEMFMEFANLKGLPGFIMFVVAAPVLEEIIFRGIILDGLLKKYSPQKAILISSLLFGIVHLNPWQFVTAMVLGVFMGWVYYHTKSLLATIIIHATANFNAFALGYFIDMEAQMDQSLIETYGGLTMAIITIVGCVLLAAGCIFYLHWKFLKETQQKA